MGEKTNRSLLALKERLNGNAKWFALAAAVLGGGGGGAYARGVLGGEPPVNKELIEFRLEKLETDVKAIRDMLDQRLPR